MYLFATARDREDQGRVVEKAWGYEDVVVNTPKYCGKVLAMEPGWQSSKHYHPEKEETMLCIGGMGVAEVWWNGSDKPPMLVSLREEEATSLHLEPGTPHRFSTPFGVDLVLAEFSTPHSDNDVIRLEVSRPLDPIVE